MNNTTTIENNQDRTDPQNANYSKLAKNTVYLFLRMIFSMGVSLYTSRVLLEALGVEDYGIYNIVGGFVSMFALISSTLTGAISRFITFELGKGDIATLKLTFKSSVVVMIGISILVVIIGETVGLWFLYNKLIIPSARLDAAFWVFQFGIATFVLSLLSTPYNACIVSHEKMGAFAYISIIEVVSKLIICFAILHSPIDKLVFFAVLLFIVGIFTRIIYISYCNKRFIECRGPLTFDKNVLKQMFSYAGWSFIGSSGLILKGQGGTILLNLFGGPIVNAANAIAVSMNSTVSNFVNCFTTALNPQITKNYASGNFNDLNRLLIYGPKISFFLLFTISLPVLLNTNFILKLWLGTVPDHTVSFVKLVLLMSLIDIISVPLVIAKNATGKIRNYQIIVGGIQLMAIPLAYILLKAGAQVEVMYIAYIIVSIACLIARMIMLNGAFPNWSTTSFLIKVCLNVFIVAAIAVALPYIVHLNFSEGWAHFFATSTVAVLSCITVTLLVGLDKNERNFVLNKVKHYISKLKR